MTALCALFMFNFKRAMLSHVLCILPQETTLPIETGRQRDPKESWREETHRSFYTHRGFYTEKSLHKGAFYTQKVLHGEVFTLRSFCTQTSRSFYTQKLLHEEVFTYREDFFTHRRVCTQKLLHREAFTQTSFYTQKRLHTASFCTHRDFYTEKPLHRGVFYTQKVLHREVFTLRGLYANPRNFSMVCACPIFSQIPEMGTYPGEGHLTLNPANMH